MEVWVLATHSLLPRLYLSSVESNIKEESFNIQNQECMIVKTVEGSRDCASTFSRG